MRNPSWRPTNQGSVSEESPGGVWEEVKVFGAEAKVEAKVPGKVGNAERVQTLKSGRKK